MGVDPDVVKRLDLVISLGETELASQVTQEAGADTKAAGLAGLAGAILVAFLIARSALGPAWWLPAVGVGIAGLFALLTLYADPLETGPKLRDFFNDIATDTEADAKTRAITDLIDDLDLNREVLTVKQGLLKVTIGVFLGTAVISIPLLLATIRG